jgi:glucosamine--fructose-6-phosphate aminotransferase (isomerizing)
VKSLGNFPDKFREEIAGQPFAVRNAGRMLADQSEALAQLWGAAGQARSIVFTGMGGSYDVCYAPVTILGEAGVPTMMIDAAELLHFRRPALGSGDLLVVVSQSGESAEVVRLVRDEWPRGRPALVSVTNGVANPLAWGADVALDTHAGIEQGPSTTTFGAALVVLAGAADVLTGRTPDEAITRAGREADRASACLEDMLDGADELADRLRAWLADRSAMALLGRGTARAAAEMGSLLMKEAARFPAESIEGGQFRHGPLELAGPGLAVAVVSTEPATRPLDVRLGSELAESGSAVLFVAPPGDAPAGAEIVTIGEVDRALSPAVAIVPLQLLAWRLAVESGRDPGMLSIASKVTTDE